MKRILLTVALLVGVSAPAAAQWQYVGFAQVTVDDTAGGVPFPASVLSATNHPFPTQAVCALETADIRWTVDGTAPTTSVGTVAAYGGYLPTISGAQLLSSFRAIRTGGSSGTLSCSFFAGGTINMPLSAAGGGGSGGGGGGGGDVTIVEGGNTAQVVTTSGGALQVSCVDCPSGNGGTAMVDDAAFTVGTTSITPAGAMFDDTSPDSVNENDGGVVRMSANRNLYTTIRDAAGNERGVNVTASNQLSVTGPVTIASAGVASGAFASGSIASGAVASGAFASGSIASGAIAAGAIAAGATSIADNEDVASANGDRGVKMLAVQQSTPADTGANADYGFLQMSVGRLWTSTAGNLAANGVAAATNRVGVLPAIVQNSAPSLTDGRDAALSLTTGGAQRVMITNAAGAASTIATDATFGTSTYTETTTTGPLVGLVRTDVPAALVNTTNEIAPLAGSALGGLYTASASDPCARLAKSYVVINIASATTTVLVAASASNRVYVCSLAIGPVGAAQNIALVEDATGSCVSPDAGLYGGTTTGTGMIFPVNGGLTLGNGEGTVIKTASTNVNVCAISSSTGQTSGVLGYVLAP